MRLVSIILLIAGGDVANAPAPCGALTLDVGTISRGWDGTSVPHFLANIRLDGYSRPGGFAA